jgi:hypothetical protein
MNAWRSANRKSQIANRKSLCGAMAAELALLTAFVYVPLIFGCIYVGFLATARQRVHEGNHYSIWAQGDQSEDYAPVGEVHNVAFHEFPGQVRVQETDPADADVPAPGEIRDMFEEFTKLQHFRNVSAHGSFSLEGSVVRYHESVRIDEGFRMRPEGQLVEAWHLLDDQIPERISDMLVDYLHRRQAHTNYAHSWFNDKDKVVAGDRDVAGWNLQIPNDATATKDEWSPEAAVRWTKVRMISDSMPPGAQQRNQVGMPLTLPVVESDYDYWHPCAGWLNVAPPPPPPAP